MTAQWRGNYLYAPSPGFYSSRTEDIEPERNPDMVANAWNPAISKC